MTRSIVRYVRWHIGPDKEATPDQTPVVSVSCTTCGESSGSVDVMTDASEDWALAHVGRHPSHTGFRFSLASYWRAVPLDGDVVAVAPPEVPSP